MTRIRSDGDVHAVKAHLDGRVSHLVRLAKPLQVAGINVDLQLSAGAGLIRPLCVDPPPRRKAAAGGERTCGELKEITSVHGAKCIRILVLTAIHVPVVRCPRSASSGVPMTKFRVSLFTTL